MSADETDRDDVLEIEEDLDFQRREWRFQRVGAAALWSLVAGALLGAFGDGPLSRAAVASPDRAWLVEYDRVVRVGASSELVLLGIGESDGDVTLSLGGDLLEYDVERVRPEPAAVETSGDWVRYRFRGQVRRGQVVFRLRPKVPGRGLLLLNASWATPLRLRQLVLF